MAPAGYAWYADADFSWYGRWSTGGIVCAYDNSGLLYDFLEEILDAEASKNAVMSERDRS